MRVLPCTFLLKWKYFTLSSNPPDFIIFCFVYLSMYVFMYLCMYVSIYIWMFASIYVCMHVSISLFVNNHVFVYICMYLSIHVNMYVCIFTYLWPNLLVLLMTPKSRIEDFSAGHIISKNLDSKKKKKTNNLDSCSSQDSALDKNLRTLDKVKHSYSIDFC